MLTNIWTIELLGIEYWWTWVQAESGRCRFKNISHTTGAIEYRCTWVQAESGRCRFKMISHTTGVMGVLEYKRNQVDVDLKTFLTLQALCPLWN